MGRYIVSEAYAKHCSYIIESPRLDYDRESMRLLVVARIYVKYPECI